MIVTYIPSIDDERRIAVVVDRYPGAKICARITTRPLHTALRAICEQRIAEQMAVPVHLLRGR